MFNWLLNKLEQKGRKLVILDREGEEPYLTRYYLRHPDGSSNVSNTFLHQFMRSDDPVYHSHPFVWYKTLILKGGYWEHSPWGVKWRGPGSYRYMDCQRHRFYDESYESLLPANLHWVEVPKPGQTWTLFTRGPKVNNGYWGFCPDPESGVMIEQQEYLEQQRKK